MEILNLGSYCFNPFGEFPIASINFNSTCLFHLDLNDDPNTLCVVCPLGTFEGGELIFPELKLIFYVKQGQAIAFRSKFLIHGNRQIINGVRHSVVFHIHRDFIKQNRLFKNLNSYIVNDNNFNSDDDKMLPPKFSIKHLKNLRKNLS